MVDSGIFSKLPSTLVGKSGSVKTSDVVGKGLCAFYFSAHWCPPCRSFTPVLAQFYDEIKEQKKDFEIIFVTSDRDDKEFNEYYESMPWLAIARSESSAISSLKNHFGVQGIPKLVVVDKAGEIVDDNARATVQNFGVDAIATWTK